MPGSIGSNRSLALGLAFSVVLHAGFGVGLACYGTLLNALRSGHPEWDQSDPAPKAPPPEDLLTLGIEESQAITPTWLGFEKPTEHSGPKSNIEQADLGPKPGTPISQAATANRPADQPPAKPEQRSSPPPSAAPTAPPAVTTPPSNEPSPAPAPGDKPEEIPPPPAAENPTPQAQPTETVPVDTSLVGPPAPPDTPVPDEPTVPAPPATDKPAPPANKNSPAPRRPGESAEESERESTAAALKDAVEVKPGQPVAAKGLRIDTVRPRWSITTQITVSPRNPVVRVTFGRNGKVVRAEFVKGQNTGWAEVDDPLMHAIYRWRAKGEALARLPASDPESGLSIIFRITLKSN